jgi:hypothetical protein
MDVMRSTLAHQLRKVKAARGDAPTQDGPVQDLPAQNPPVDYSVQAWEAPSGRYWDKTDLKNDMLLIDLAKGVVHWPTDAGRRHLSIAVERAVRLEHCDVMLSDVRAQIDLAKIGKDLPAIDARGDPDRLAKVDLKDVIDPCRGTVPDE